MDRDRVSAFESGFAWGVWIATTALAFVATAIYGRWLPWSDDFSIIPFVTGDTPVSLEWLWNQHNEHRIPLVKLLFVSVGRMSGGDYRWTLAANTLFLSATAAALIVAARRLRGSSSWTDAMFPAVILHLGQGALVWAFHTQFLLTTTLGGIFVATTVAAPSGSVWRAAIMAVGACLLPMTGSSGLVIAAAATCLLGAEALGWNAATDKSTRLARWIAAAGACTTIAIAIAYVATLKLTHAKDYAGAWQTLIAGLDTLTSYAGVLVNEWPTAWRLATIAAVVGTVAVAVRTMWRMPGSDRSRLLILLGYLAALGLVALAVGYGRGTRDFAHLYGHYSTLALGVPVAIGLIWAALPQTRAARVVQAALCIAALMIASEHARKTIRSLGSGREQWAVIATDMRGELSAEDVAVRHGAALFFIDTPDTRRMIARGITALRSTTYPLYCTRQPQPPQDAAVPGATGGTGDVEAE